ncbi:MAG: amidohydrolase family protein [Spirochaetales bacterium]|nr:amidohydrolase family protein [Spirochaetales bacterium]
MIQGIEVIDIHSHFPVAGDWFPGYARVSKRITKQKTAPAADVQGEIWRKAWNFPAEREEVTDDREASDRWYRDIVDKGVERVVFVSGGGNDRLAGIVGYHPDRFIGFAHHHPFADGAAGELEHALKELGMRGYKLLAPSLDRPISDPALFPLWEICQKHAAPVLIHFGILGGSGGISAHMNINPLALHDAAKAFPRVNFIVPHFGAGYPTELLHLCWTCPNVYVDSSGSNQWVRWMAYPLTLQDLFRKFCETVGPDRLLFATDSSWFPRTFTMSYLEEQHRILRFLRLPDGDIEKILHGNAERLLGLER